MYILFINLGASVMFFFLLNLIRIVIKKNYPTHGFNPTQPNPYGLGWTYVMGWVGLNFFDPPWWVGSKNPLNPTHAHPYSNLYLRDSMPRASRSRNRLTLTRFL